MGIFEDLEDISEDTTKPIERIMDNLFKDEEAQIQRTTDLSPSDIIWASQFEIVDKILVEGFIYDRRQKEICKEIKNSLYRIRVSKDRKGRQEMFDALKQEIKMERIKEANETLLANKKI